MLLTILLAAVQAVPVPAAAPAQPELRPYVRGAGSGADCERPTMRHAQNGAPLRPRRFTELPAGRLELAVFRELDGCPIPAVVRENIGGTPSVGKEPGRR